MSPRNARAGAQGLKVLPGGAHGGNSSADERAGRAARRTRRQSAEIERLPFDLSALDSDGIFVNVDASGFSMLDRRLDWQSVGITLPRETDVSFRPPRCGIIPNRYRRPLLSPAAQGHVALRKYSYQFRLTETLFETPAYRYVPWRAFAEFEGAFERATANLEAAKKSVLDDYDKIREEVLVTFDRLATDSAQRLLATGVVVPADFRERMRTSVLDALPSEHDLRERLTLRYQVGVVLLGSEMLAEQRRALEERSSVERERAAADLARQQERAREEAVQQQMWVSRERARQRLAAEREEQQREAAVKERLRNLKLEAARERLQETLDPLVEGAKQMRAEIYEAACAMRDAWIKHGHLPGATTRKARNLAKWFRVMDISRDESLGNLINELERRAGATAQPGKKKRTAKGGNVKAVLDDIIALTYRDAHDLAAPSRVTALEL